MSNSWFTEENTSFLSAFFKAVYLFVFSMSVVFCFGYVFGLGLKAAGF